MFDNVSKVCGILYYKFCFNLLSHLTLPVMGLFLGVCMPKSGDGSDSKFVFCPLYSFYFFIFGMLFSACN